MFFLFMTYFIFFLKKDFIHCMANNSIFLFLPFKFISICRIVSVVLSRNSVRKIRTKVSQDLTLIWIIPVAMYEICVFVSILHIIYIPFSVLASAISHLGVCIWRGGLSSHFTDFTRTVNIWPSMFLIRGF